MSKSRISKTFKKARVIFLALFVVLLFVSCSPESLTLCNVGINIDNDSRALSAVILDYSIENSFKIYYKSIYKGNDGSSYGDMSNSGYYKKLAHPVFCCSIVSPSSSGNFNS